MMDHAGLEHDLDALAEALMLADPVSRADIADLRDRYQSLVRFAEETGRSELLGACHHALEIIGSIEEGSGDPGKLLTELGRSFTALRETALGAPSAILPTTVLPQCNTDAGGPSDSCETAGTFSGDAELLADFVVRALEHLDEADEQMVGLERDPSDLEALNAVFRAFHTIKGMAGFLGLRKIESLCHEAESVLDGPRKGLGPLGAEETAVVFGHTDSMRALVDAVRDGGTEVAAESELRSTTPSHSQPTIRVYEERLDALLDMIGELVIAESAVADGVRGIEAGSEHLLRQLDRLDKITRGLQESATALRMVPLKASFRRLARLARDVARKSGKAIECVVTGEGTELDKAVVDTIVDPLMHLVRNAIDHGIENDPTVRERAGKPGTATIRIHAEQVGSGIRILIADDGAGLDADAIARKARDDGVTLPENPTSDQLIDLLFAPGFSTAEKVTDISGRGVGLDVVKRTVEALRGQVSVATVPGAGTAFTISLPLTLAIIDGMVARVGEERYVIPTLSIVRSLQPASGEVSKVLGSGEALHTEGGFVPLVRLDRVLGVEGAIQDPSDGIIVVVDEGERRAGLILCELIGQQQTVIKPLSEALAHAPGISGGAIMADGSVGLVLDVGGLVRMATAKRE